MGFPVVHMLTFLSECGLSIAKQRNILEVTRPLPRISKKLPWLQVPASQWLKTVDMMCENRFFYHEITTWLRSKFDEARLINITYPAIFKKKKKTTYKCFDFKVPDFMKRYADTQISWLIDTNIPNAMKLFLQYGIRT